MFSRFFIDRPIFACVISIIIMLGGGITIPLLPVEQTPDITPPTVSVSTTYRGASAQVVAETVAAVIEEEVNGVENMIYMSSKSSDDGKYDLTVTFEVGTDIDMATVLVQNRVAIAMPKLPDDVKREGVKTEKRSTNMVLMVNMIRNREDADTRNDAASRRDDEIYISNYITTRIKDELARVPGIGKIQVMGAKDYGMRIWLDPNQLKARNLTTTDVVEAIRAQNVQVAAGQIGAPPAPTGQVFQYTVNALGRLTDVEQFENMIIKVGERGDVLRVRDIARVELGAQDYSWSVELNRQPSIAIGAYQLPGANALEVANGIRAKMDELQKSFPADLEYAIKYDTTMFVKASIAEVIETLLIAVALVILTVYIFLQDFRTTLIPAMTIPVSLIGTFGVMMGLGLSINTLSLFGLVLAIGVVVDDAIVVVENTMRLMEEEKLSSKEAAKKAMLQVTGPVVATTLVLLAVFVPTAMMGGITGRLYNQFALTIATATVFSSLNALTLSPALCGMLLGERKGEKTGVMATILATVSYPFTLLYNVTLGPFFKIFNATFTVTTNGYMGVVGMLVRQMVITVLLFGGLLAAMVFGFIRVPTGFLPDEDQGYLIINAQLPDGATLERSEQVMNRITDIVEKTPGVSDIVGIGGYSGLDSLAMSNAATLFVVLKPWEERPADQHAAEIVASLQPQLAQIYEANAFAFLPPPITGLGNAGGFEFQLQDRGGAGITELQEIGTDLVDAGNASGVVTRMNSNLRANVPQLYLEVDRTKVMRMGVPLMDVFNTLQAFLGSAYVNDFNKFGRVFKVMVQADDEFRNQIEDVQQINVRNNRGEMVPMGTLLDVTDTAGPKTVFRYNSYSSTTITGQPAPGFSSGQAIGTMENLAANVLPPSMGYEWSGVTYQQIKAGAQAPIIFSLALIVVYLFLAAQYESWMIPFAVILSVPLALLGALAGTWIRSYDNNIYTQIGLVLLIGLSAKTAILIVEFAKQRREEGHSVIDAATGAARLRFRAILMTAFSFILGVAPLVIASGAGAGSRRALGTAVFAGMTAATIFGVFLIPALYVVVQRTSETLRGVSDEEAAVQPLEK